MRIIGPFLVLAIAGTGLLFGLNRTPVDSKTRPADAGAFSGATMGTTYSVKVAGLSTAANRDRLAAEIQGQLDRINRLMSTYDPDSELSRFNASDSGQWFPVSPETARVVAEAIRVGDLSGGALDVTVGPIVDLWSFGPEARPQGVLPTGEEITAAMSTVGYTRLEVRHDPPALRKPSPACRVDLSSLAKGFAVDQVVERLEELGIDRYMVEVGGEIRTAGLNSSGNPWQIAVELPTTEGRGIQRVVPLDGRAMATSGDYRNYFEQDGVRFCHIIDPRAGRPVSHRLASVSVLADNCMRADALATALFVLGPEEGLQLAAEHSIPALFLVRTDRGFAEYPISHFPVSPP
ncbi:MAG: FAD:protein FMN transferase [Planctomycetaceae bacterium]|nr:FAD:protein FMN transferase [Planctomycetaceae bacterium]